MMSRLVVFPCFSAVTQKMPFFAPGNNHLLEPLTINEMNHDTFTVFEWFETIFSGSGLIRSITFPVEEVSTFLFVL